MFELNVVWARQVGVASGMHAKGICSFHGHLLYSYGIGICFVCIVLLSQFNNPSPKSETLFLFLFLIQIIGKLQLYNVLIHPMHTTHIKGMTSSKFPI